MLIENLTLNCIATSSKLNLEHQIEEAISINLVSEKNTLGSLEHVFLDSKVKGSGSRVARGLDAAVNTNKIWNPENNKTFTIADQTKAELWEMTNHIDENSVTDLGTVSPFEKLRRHP
ncbi:hypothetical protein GWI33_016724 [Rhynchophorus ferrugineus]|uniref:Uncharacterized protein n=1 Tax=Rhynchophorus ferrugineus TaxID=354439 RepID=A0A834I344_RHYFE|nr:hypothetical protein GWI33_016724 [Rhynchophorus ferrugineus]